MAEEVEYTEYVSVTQESLAKAIDIAYELEDSDIWGNANGLAAFILSEPHFERRKIRADRPNCGHSLYARGPNNELVCGEMSCHNYAGRHR